jgi:FkbM family methyltransferase
MSIPTQERESILSLIKYFAPHWLIIDCGSNKGDWYGALIEHRDGSTEAGKYSVWSIEPNDRLRIYQEVKNDYNDQIRFLPYAAYNKSGEKLNFYYWENRNSGLSSLLNNRKWEKELGEFRLQKAVTTIALDDVMIEGAEADIIKIDVEGAEWLVLQGCKDLLKNKKVKFIQVEYSEHYQINNYKFKDILEYAEQFGYSAWSWDGNYWIKVRKDEFIEDYRLENFLLTYKNIARGSRDYINFNYTQLWNNEFKRNTEFLKGKVNLALEIGSFEGLTTNYICDELLNENGRVICIDPLIDGVYLEGHKDNFIFDGQYERFIHNTKDQPVELQRTTSREAFKGLEAYRFGLIYVDGDHTEEAVYRDGKAYFTLLQENGYMLFDDYGQSEETKRGVDRFLNEHIGRLGIVLKEYQVLIKRIAR